MKILSSEEAAAWNLATATANAGLKPRAEFLTELVAKLHAGEITKGGGRLAIRSYDAAVKRELSRPRAPAVFS